MSEHVLRLIRPVLDRQHQLTTAGQAVTYHPESVLRAIRRLLISGGQARTARATRSVPKAVRIAR